MKTVTTMLLALLVGGWSAGETFALGADHPPDVLAAQGKTCVHGYWVNDSDVFFHAGDAAAFNEFAANLAKKPGVKLRIVLHKGTKKARSPWDEADRDIPVDWSVTTWGQLFQKLLPDAKGDETRIDLWLGGKIKKDALKIPAGAAVELEGES